MPDIIVSGVICLDLFPRMQDVPLQTLTTPGRLIEVGQIDVATGGAVSNTGLTLHRLGVNVGLMSTVGDDFIGRIIIDSLNAQDPKLSQYLALREGQPSSYSIVLQPENADRTFLHCPGTNSTFEPNDLDYSVIGEAKIFHLGYPTLMPRLISNNGAGLRDLFERAKATGVITSMDMALPDPNGLAGRVDWRRILNNTLPYVDVFLPSIEEIIFMLRREDYDSCQGNVVQFIDAEYLSLLAGELLAMGVVVAGFKLGLMGMYVRTATAPTAFKRLKRAPFDAFYWQNKTIWMPAFEVDVAGTTGAGDSAYAGFLTALLRGSGPFEAVQWACAVGACNVEAVDSTSGIQSWQETQARLQSEWPVRQEELPGW